MAIGLGSDYTRLTPQEDRTLHRLMTEVHNIAALMEGQEQPVIARVAEDAKELRGIVARLDRLVAGARQRAGR